MNQINRNFPWCDEYSDESFLGIIHEKEVWDGKAYFELEEFLFQECAKLGDSEIISREQAWRVMRIFSYIMLLFACHLDSNDGFEINNITNEQYIARRERVQLVFEGFFSGEMPAKEYLEY